MGPCEESLPQGTMPGFWWDSPAGSQDTGLQIPPSARLRLHVCHIGGAGLADLLGCLGEVGEVYLVLPSGFGTEGMRGGAVSISQRGKLGLRTEPLS